MQGRVFVWKWGEELEPKADDSKVTQGLLLFDGPLCLSLVYARPGEVVVRSVEGITVFDENLRSFRIDFNDHLSRYVIAIGRGAKDVPPDIEAALMSGGNLKEAAFVEAVQNLLSTKKGVLS